MKDTVAKSASDVQWPLDMPPSEARLLVIGRSAAGIAAGVLFLRCRHREAAG